MDGHFVGYRIDGYDPDHATPIATGRTREDAMRVAIRRVLQLCDVNASIGVQECKELTEPQFVELTTIIEDWAAKHYLPAAQSDEADTQEKDDLG